MSKIMSEVVTNAVSEMRRYYSRKVVDVLVKITKQSIDELRKKFNSNCGECVSTYTVVTNAAIVLC